MKKVKTIVAIVLVLACAATNVALLSTDASAVSQDPDKVYQAGFELHDADGNVIGCDCPALTGTCICKIKPNN